MNKKITTHTIRNMKNKKRISMLTAYDYPMAKIIDESECEMILDLSHIHISEPTRPLYISYAGYCLQKNIAKNT